MTYLKVSLSTHNWDSALLKDVMEPSQTGKMLKTASIGKDKDPAHE